MNNITKNRFIVTLIFSASVLMSWAQNANNEFTIPLSDPSKKAKLKAHLNYGSITIKGVARKDVLVKYTTESDEEDQREGKGKTKDGLRRIGGGGIELEVSENSNYVKVESNSWNNKMNLEIEVPLVTDLEAHTYNDGDLMMTNVQGQLELSNYNGEITALNISGSVVASTYNGDIKVTFDKTTDGTPMSYSTYNGDIDLTFPSTSKATFKMKTEQGDIYTGFEMNIASSGLVQTKEKSGGYKMVVDEWKRGDINGGGAVVTMKNYNGDIYIRKKEK